MARDAGSLHVEEDVLYSKYDTQLVFFSLYKLMLIKLPWLLKELQMELEQLCYADALVYQPLYEMIEVLCFHHTYLYFDETENKYDN